MLCAFVSSVLDLVFLYFFTSGDFFVVVLLLVILERAKAVEDLFLYFYFSLLISRGRDKKGRGEFCWKLLL